MRNSEEARMEQRSWDSPDSAHAWIQRAKRRQEWDYYFMEVAEAISGRSKDPKSKLGAVIVQGDVIVATGYNGFPRGIEDYDWRWERPTKYSYVAHAEANAICNAASRGVPTAKATLYLFGFPGPCTTCAQLIIQAGIERVVWYEDELKMSDPEAKQQWEENLGKAQELLFEADLVQTRLPLRQAN